MWDKFSLYGYIIYLQLKSFLFGGEQRLVLRVAQLNVVYFNSEMFEVYFIETAQHSLIEKLFQAKTGSLMFCYVICCKTNYW